MKNLYNDETIKQLYSEVEDVILKWNFSRQFDESDQSKIYQLGNYIHLNYPNCKLIKEVEQESKNVLTREEYALLEDKNPSINMFIMSEKSKQHYLNLQLGNKAFYDLSDFYARLKKEEGIKYIYQKPENIY